MIIIVQSILYSVRQTGDLLMTDLSRNYNGPEDDEPGGDDDGDQDGSGD